MNLDPLNLTTRFLFPFSFEPASLADLQAALAQSSYRRLKFDRETREYGWISEALWEAEEPGGRYLEEFLDGLTRRLFSDESGALYYRVAAATVERWTQRGFDLDDIHVQFAQDASGGVELFLQPEGAGVLSITIAAAQPLKLAAVKTVNYRLCQDRPEKSGFLQKPASAHSPAGFEEPATALESMQVEGKPFQVKALCLALVKCIEPFGMRPLQLHALLQPYSVVQFPVGVEFTSVERPAGLTAEQDLCAFAASLAQVEEAPHPSPPKHDPGVPTTIFASDQMASVSCMGSTHLTCATGLASDHERPIVYRDKYFIAYLAALFQHLILLELSRRASSMVKLDERERPGKLNELRDATLIYVAGAHFAEISIREVVNRYYSLCQRAHRIPEALNLVQQTITDLDSAIQAKKQTGAVHALAATQEKVEWIEVFVVSFYSFELSHVLGEMLGFEHLYNAMGALAVFAAAFCITIWKLRLLETHEGHKAPSLLAPVLLAMAVLGLFLALGSAGFREKPEERRLSAAQEKLMERERAAAQSRYFGHPAIQRRFTVASNWLNRALGEGAAHAEAEVRAGEELTAVETLEAAAQSADAMRGQYVECRRCSQRGSSDARRATALWEAGEFREAQAAWREALR